MVDDNRDGFICNQYMGRMVGIPSARILEFQSASSGPLMLSDQEITLMSHPPTLAVAIIGVLAIATAADTYRFAHLPKPGVGRNAENAITPAERLDRALQVLRIDSNRGSISPTM